MIGGAIKSGDLVQLYDTGASETNMELGLVINNNERIPTLWSVLIPAIGRVAWYHEGNIKVIQGIEK